MFLVDSVATLSEYMRSHNLKRFGLAYVSFDLEGNNIINSINTTYNQASCFQILEVLTLLVLEEPIAINNYHQDVTQLLTLHETAYVSWVYGVIASACHHNLTLELGSELAELLERNYLCPQRLHVCLKREY